MNSSHRLRVRDVLPLPIAADDAPLSAPSAAPAVSTCRKTQRKHKRYHHEKEWAEQCAVALNNCWGRGSSVESATLRPVGVSSVLSGIKEAVAQMGKPPPDMTPEGAYKKLLGGSSSYTDVRADLATFDLEQVSWPEVGGEHCQVVDLLPTADSIRLRDWRDSMLREPSESLELQHELGLSRPYCDPALLQSPLVYGRFLQEMHARGLVDFVPATSAEASLGIFFVKKKDGKQRIIFDTRVINCSFVSPESISLPTAGSLGGVEVDADETLYVATCDVSTAFYRMLVPPSLREQFTLPPIESRYLGGAGGDLRGLLMPRLTVLPMGWSWSLRFCQLIVESFVTAEVGMENTIKDGEPFIRVKAGAAAGAAYVDNVLVFATDKRKADKCLHRIAESLTSAGLLVHEVNMASDRASFLGLELAGNRLRVSAERAWRVRLALEFALKKRFISPAAMEVIVGHVVWLFMCRREMLSVLCHVYRHIKQEPRATALPMTDALAAELRDIVGLLPLCYTTLDADWSDTLHASDASPYGIGVCYSHVEPGVAGDIGRQAEKLRYAVGSSTRARASALGVDPKAPAHRSLEFASDDARTELESSLSKFSEVAAGICIHNHWRVVTGFRHSHSEHITQTEGRALLIAAQHSVRSASKYGCKHLFLVDNLALCHAVNRGRSSSFSLQRIIRQLAALSIATGSKFVCRWIPSERNVADFPSRMRPIPFVGLGLLLWPNGKSLSAQRTATPSTGFEEGEDLESDQDILLGGLTSKYQLARPESECSSDLAPAGARVDINKYIDFGRPPGFWGPPGLLEESSGRHECGSSNADAVHCVDPRVRAHLHGHGLGLEDRRGAGLSHRVCPRQAVLRRPGGGRREQARRRDPVVPATVPPGGRRTPPSDARRARRLLQEAAGPTEVATAVGRGLRRDRRAHPQRPQDDGATGGHRLLGVPAPKRERQPSLRELGAADNAGRRSVLGMGAIAASEQRKHPRQDGELRRVGGVGGLQSSDSSASQPQVEQGGRREVVVAQRPRHDPRVGHCHQSAGSRRSEPISVCPTPRRSVRGSVVAPSKRARGKEERALGVRRVTQALWQGDEAPEGALESPPQRSQLRQVRDGALCAGDARYSSCAFSARQGKRLRRSRAEDRTLGGSGRVVGKLCRSEVSTAPKSGTVLTSEEKKRRLQLALKDALSKAKLRKHQVFLDLYGGTGGVSASLRALGFGVITFDLDLGSQFDLCDPVVIGVIRGWITSGIVLGIMLAPPCGSWSRALTLWGHPVRSKDRIYGLPNLPAHREIVRLLGNCTMRNAYKIATCAVRQGLPVILEQPCGSLMLHTPEHIKLSKQVSFRGFNVDQCQFGTRWRKRTTLCFWNTTDPSALEKRCISRTSVCSRSGKYHLQLMGKDPISGRNWTSIAQHYPRPLCRGLAQMLVGSSDAAIHARRKQLYSLNL